VLPLLGCLSSLLYRPRWLLSVGLACLSSFNGCVALLLALFMDLPAPRLWGLGVAFQSSAVVVAALAALCAMVVRPTLKECSGEHQEVIGVSAPEVVGAEHADLEEPGPWTMLSAQALEAKTGSLATSEESTREQRWPVLTSCFAGLLDFAADRIAASLELEKGGGLGGLGGGGDAEEDPLNAVFYPRA